MSWSEIVRLLGLIAAALALVTFTLGYFRLNIKDRVKLHKIFAFALIAVMLVHGGIVIYRTYFMSGLQKIFNP